MCFPLRSRCDAQLRLSSLFFCLLGPLWISGRREEPSACRRGFDLLHSLYAPPPPKPWPHLSLVTGSNLVIHPPALLRAVLSAYRFIRKRVSCKYHICSIPPPLMGNPCSVVSLSFVFTITPARIGEKTIPKQNKTKQNKNKMPYHL